MNQRAQPLVRLLARWIVEDHQAGRLPVAIPAVSSHHEAPAPQRRRRQISRRPVTRGVEH